MTKFLYYTFSRQSNHISHCYGHCVNVILLAPRIKENVASFYIFILQNLMNVHRTCITVIVMQFVLIRGTSFPVNARMVTLAMDFSAQVRKNKLSIFLM